MISDKLYELAFKYKKTKLWNSLHETKLFAVKLSDGKIGYISITKTRGIHSSPGLCMYIGNDGLDSFRRMIKTDPLLASPFELHELLIQQNCLNCTFENKNKISQKEQEETKKYACSHGIRLSGKNTYPLFRKIMPNLCPWYLQAQKDQDDLCEGLSAAIALAEMLSDKSPDDLGLTHLQDTTTEIPLLEYQDQTYVLGKTPLPPETPIEEPAPKASNQIGLASLKKIQRSGIWECKLIHFPQPIQTPKEEIPFFPVILLAVESSSGYILQVPPVEHYEDNPEELLNLFIESLLRENICPLKMIAYDERAYAFAKTFCQKLKIALSIEEDLPALEEAANDFFYSFDNDEQTQLDDIDKLLDMLLVLDGKQLGTLPDEAIELLKAMSAQGLLPDDMEAKLDMLLHLNDTGKSDHQKPKISRKRLGPKQSYVISVSLKAGCYRHIQLSEDCMLFHLHSAILDAFGFSDDHAHAFFMDNILWSHENAYFIEGMEPYDRTTTEYTLAQTGLYKGMKFKYLFDFGDEWVFQCKVLKSVEGDTEYPKILKSVGEAPEQYGFWDEDE